MFSKQMLIYISSGTLAIHSKEIAPTATIIYMVKEMWMKTNGFLIGYSIKGFNKNVHNMESSKVYLNMELKTWKILNIVFFLRVNVFSLSEIGVTKLNKQVLKK